MLYKAIFLDGSEFEGGNSVFNTKWTSIPNDKGIKEVHYFLSDGNKIVLKDYEAYNHIVEATRDIYGPKGMKLQFKLHNVYIMGLKNNIVTSYRISLKGKKGQDKYLAGDITKRESPLGKEFRGHPTVNWKKGII